MPDICYSNNEEYYGFIDWEEAVYDLLEDQTLNHSDTGYGITTIYKGKFIPVTVLECCHIHCFSDYIFETMICNYRYISIADHIIDNISEETSSDWFEFKCSEEQKRLLDCKINKAISNWVESEKIDMDNLDDSNYDQNKLDENLKSAILDWEKTAGLNLGNKISNVKKLKILFRLNKDADDILFMEIIDER